jgi:arylsulfatase A-like enzyme
MFTPLLRCSWVALAVVALSGAGGICRAETAVKPAQPLPGVKHVLLVGFDGFGAYAWEKAEMPRLKALAADGAYSLKTRAVMPVISAPNWGAHLTGAGPESHGYTSNAKIPSPPPVVLSKYGRFPGIFGLVRDAYPEAETGVFYDWGRIHELVENKAVSFEKEVKRRDDGKTNKARSEREAVLLYEESSEKTASTAAKYILQKKPFFTFVYLVAPDETGHAIGHDTPEYFATLKKCDAYLGNLLDALKEAGIEKETLVLVIADHGGFKKGHGGATLQGMQTPWVIAGPGVKRGHVLKSNVVHYDTAATLAHVFGVKVPQVWRGRPVLEAFEKNPEN